MTAVSVDMATYIISGIGSLTSAIIGAQIVAIRAKTLQMPKILAVTILGKYCGVIMYTKLKPRFVPNFVEKTRMSLQIGDACSIKSIIMINVNSITTCKAR